MSIDLTEDTVTEAVQRSFDTSADERFRQLFVCLVQHLHDFAREVRLTGEEWLTAMDFLERVGKISSPTRQEFVLLSDILGLSMLLDKINEHGGLLATDSALLGPFYVEGRPMVANGSDISGGLAGTPMFVTGRVVDEEGAPITGAHVDTWHSDGEGFYDVQQAEKLHDQLAMRALLTTDENGRFWYRSIAPRYYPASTDGPGGEILRGARRSVMRPQHASVAVHAWRPAPTVRATCSSAPSSRTWRCCRTASRNANVAPSRWASRVKKNSAIADSSANAPGCVRRPSRSWRSPRSTGSDCAPGGGGENMRLAASCPGVNEVGVIAHAALLETLAADDLSQNGAAATAVR